MSKAANACIQRSASGGVVGARVAGAKHQPRGSHLLKTVTLYLLGRQCEQAHAGAR
jgi:hypothetical protein